MYSDEKGQCRRCRPCHIDVVAARRPCRRCRRRSPTGVDGWLPAGALLNVEDLVTHADGGSECRSLRVAVVVGGGSAR